MTNTASRDRAISLVALLATTIAIACTAPLYQPPPIAAAKSPVATRTAILTALIHGHYTVVSEQPARIVARFSRGDWTMDVGIDYSDQVTVRYVNSENLKYGIRDGTPMIHRGYNKRVQRLAKVIGTELALARIDEPLPAVAAPPPGGQGPR